MANKYKRLDSHEVPLQRKTDSEAEADTGDEHLRIVLLGKTGSGKSSLANTMFGDQVFATGHTASSATSVCKKETRMVNGTTVSFIDTPGFFDNHQSEEQLKDEITKCVTECSPGPHAFLILLKVERFTEHENEVITKIKESFSEEAFKYAVLVFTHGDQLPEGMNIEEYYDDNNSLRELLKKCGGRCHVFDNKYWKENLQDEYRNNQCQTEKLLNTIKEMVKNNGGCYTNEMLRGVERIIQQEEERISASSGNKSKEEVREQAKSIVYDILKKAAGITTGVLLGALLGVPAMILSVVAVLKFVEIPLQTAVTATGGATGTGVGVVVGIGAIAGAIGGGIVGYQEADEADSIMGAVGNTAKAIGAIAIKPVTAIAKGMTQTETSHMKK